MTKEKLIDKYHKIFEPCWEFECPDTWLPKIEQLCNILTLYAKRHNVEVTQICQIKVKISTARIYPYGSPSPTEASWFNACEKACNNIGHVVIDNKSEIVSQDVFDKTADLRRYLLMHPDQTMVKQACLHYLGDAHQKFDNEI